MPRPIGRDLRWRQRALVRRLCHLEARGACKSDASFDPETTAVVLIEFQNDFTTEGGVLHGAVEGEMEQTGMLKNAKKVAAKARENGATVSVMTPASRQPHARRVRPEASYTVDLTLPPSTATPVKGSWGAAITDELAPEAGDIVIEGKRGLDTFASTNLDFMHENALKYDYPMFLTPMTSDEFLDALE